MRASLDARLQRLEQASELDAEIERLLARMTPDERAAFIAECAHDFGTDIDNERGWHEHNRITVSEAGNIATGGDASGGVLPVPAWATTAHSRYRLSRRVGTGGRCARDMRAVRVAD